MDHLDINSDPGCIILGILRAYGRRCCAGGYVRKSQG